MNGNDTELHRSGHHDDPRIAPERCLAMHCPALVASIDAMFNLTGWLIRTGEYSVLGHATSDSDTTVMVLGGAFFGDAVLAPGGRRYCHSLAARHTVIRRIE
jgi:hypothetical protein